MMAMFQGSRWCSSIKEHFVGNILLPLWQIQQLSDDVPIPNETPVVNVRFTAVDTTNEVLDEMGKERAPMAE